MTTLAEKFLSDWGLEYEGSQCVVSAPKFSNSCEYSDIKGIPHQLFEDGSLIIVYKDWTGTTYYQDLDSSDELDNEWDMEWSEDNNDYAMQNVWA